MKRCFVSSLLLVAALLPAGIASAENALIDYQGFAWEDGHFPISQPGDLFNLVAVVDAIDVRFGVDLGSEEVTIWVTDLVSTGQVDQGGGIFAVAFTGGTLQSGVIRAATTITESIRRTAPRRRPSMTGVCSSAER